MTNSAPPRYSIIIPLPVDGQILEKQAANLSEIFERHVDDSYEIVSVDRTHPEQIAEEIDQIKGEVIIIIDGDVSHPPAILDEVLNAFERGADLVMGGNCSNSDEEVEPVVTCFGIRTTSANHMRDSQKILYLTLNLLGPEGIKKIFGKTTKPGAEIIPNYLRRLIIGT